ncbi:Unknown protein [Striga hermonthica]|uniref:Uncharacterized protein n=1 Tax=Striga hermonthica TaxID=68872 RepID=A0A9N7MIF9_STRHE|nr:Unknown protein [Striga hermonthica]
MATQQLCKPCDQQVNHTVTCHEKTTTKVETCHNKHAHEHSFTDKVKDMTHKIFDHNKHPHNNNCSTTGVKTHHHHQVKKTEGQDGHCLPKMFDHNTKKHKKKSRKNKHDGGCSDSGSSSSSDESDNEKSSKNKC